MTHEQEAEALAAMREGGLQPPSIKWNGEIHRCGTVDKPNSKNGSYKAHGDEPASLYWKNWATGEEGTWSVKGGKDLTAEEKAEFARRMAEARKIRDAEQARIHAEKAKTAQAINSKAEDCSAHPYLVAKGVQPVTGLKVYNGAMVVPLYDENGKIVSLQFIDADGKKRFLTGGRKKGCFFPIGKDRTKPLLICEGVATGLSLYECTGNPVLVAFDAGNLLSVAKMARSKYPEREIILCADNDTETEGNPGLTKATEAAKAVGGSVAVPDLGGRKGDWNDLHQEKGIEEVHAQFKPFKPDGSPEPQNEKKKTSNIRCVNIREFLMQEIPERETLLSPIIPRQGLLMLHAMRGIGKTFISLFIAFAVASGGKVFNRWTAPQPARVLFIDGEMPARALQKRLAAIVAGSDQEPPDPDFLRIITPDMQGGSMPNLATREGQEAVEPFLDGVSLVIVDNLATLARNGRSNDEESWIPVQGWLLDLRRRGISVLMIHHQGKGGDQRGTSAKEDILDTVIGLRRPKDYKAEEGARFEVHLTKARGVYGEEAQPFEAQLLEKDHILTWTARTIEDARLEQLRQLIAEGYTIRDAALEMEISKSAAGRLKKKLDAMQMESRISQGTSFSSLGGGL
ncbi:AAA family ATPase [Desulfococcaceae bacterium OttesenSCG-928-F15]|nr:AAA family ATPase [Desulfococcaceae bacterium OttesenSCG-928-F15]